jgi:predicted dehydrogenase
MIASDRPVRFGVLGAARIVTKALIAPAREISGAEVYAIASRDAYRARAFAAANQIPVVMRDYAELVANPEIDAVYIPLPNSLHCKWTIAALHAGKHVLCEKPFAANMEQAIAMQKTAVACRLIAAEAFHYCYHPLADRIRTLLADGAIGRPSHFDAAFCVPIPPPNMLPYFSGMEPRVVSADARLFSPQIDIAMRARLDFPDGATASINCSMESGVSPGARLLVQGTKGELEAINPIAPHNGNVLILRTAAGEQREAIAGEASFFYQLRAFIQALRGAQSIRIDGAEAVANMRLVDAVYGAAGLAPRAT